MAKSEMPESYRLALVDPLAELLARVDEMPEMAEYREYAAEVLEALWAAGYEVRPRDDVLWGQESGQDVAWGTALNGEAESLAPPA